MAEYNPSEETERQLPRDEEINSDSVESEGIGYIEETEQRGEDNPSAVGDDMQVADPTDDTGLVQSDYASFQLPTDAVVLPVTQANFHDGLEQKVESSARWMATWCVYMIKKYGGRTFFKG